MKQFLFSFFLFFYCAVSKAQDTGDYTYTDQRALAIHTDQTYSTTSIAAYILSNFNNEKEKLRAIYTWVTANIKYDPDSMYVINSDKDPEARITAALRRRKGVCENYAAIFNDIAVRSGIRSYTVSGYTKQLGSIDRSGHTWCAVFIDNDWFFCDPTWDEGRRWPAKWFLVSPDQFIESHMPFDPVWQLLDHPISHKDFYTGNFYSRKNNTKYNSRDSINAYLSLNSLQQFEAASRRIQQAGLANQLVINQLAYVRMQAGIIYEEKDMDLYNGAVTHLNNATKILNEFIQYRNNRFIPVRSEQEMNNMFVPADSILASAFEELDVLTRSTHNFQYDPVLLKERLESFSAKLKEQKDFLKLYISTAPGLREHLFYK